MDFQDIKNDEHHQQMLDWVNSRFDLNPVPDSAEGKRLLLALSLIKQYKDIHYAIPQ